MSFGGCPVCFKESAVRSQWLYCLRYSGGLLVSSLFGFEFSLWPIVAAIISYLVITLTIRSIEFDAKGRSTRCQRGTAQLLPHLSNHSQFKHFFKHSYPSASQPFNDTLFVNTACVICLLLTLNHNALYSRY